MLERANVQGLLRVSVEEATVAVEASTTGAVLLLLAPSHGSTGPRTETFDPGFRGYADAESTAPEPSEDHYG